PQRPDFLGHVFRGLFRSLAALGISAAGSRFPSLRSGSLTPAKRLKFEPRELFLPPVWRTYRRVAAGVAAMA
ncbi:MAG TPA: hypothetical protein VES66_02285, partial [Terriglobales bacterium]|nr:hypothetical protein [Terriglobales bacterium]